MFGSPRYMELVAEEHRQLDKLLAVGGEKARSVSSSTLATAYERVGLVPAASA